MKALDDYCPYYHYSGLDRSEPLWRNRGGGGGGGEGQGGARALPKTPEGFSCSLPSFFFLLSGSPPELAQALQGQCRGLLNSPFPRAHSLTSCLRAPGSEDPILLFWRLGPNNVIFALHPHQKPEVLETAALIRTRHSVDLTDAE